MTEHPLPTPDDDATLTGPQTPTPQRVAAVRESLQNGTYKINPDAIASRMLDLDQQLHG